ncbi:MAG: Hg(II)-responsive transcriptional regulator [Betaproteobacteria bacterium RBG_16_64_9]|nr:MAG: Hg(II)-responsive transcriptional regulator [Betaproteobacteria bacterium RBG_16_64_9]OGA26293.1 MAG: Hg(II)-responsive transcriptional regulator [Betaproteobacteria bacterium RIFCSPLOWO2_02_FULL_65_24]OGA90348.1 MAG: Hg(II)-responsive transcriptional regulator [Betaproteobacteria bacterium RIFCSPLOWO2_12_FULL_66_14]
MNSSLTIGRVAAAAGVNVETIRFYQRLGLLAEPVRPLGGVRRYGHEVVVRLRFIKRAQQLGFSLAEVQRLLILEDPQSCGKARSLAAEKLALIEARIADLKRMRGVLKELVARCDVRRGKVACPIIATLTENPENSSCPHA